MSSLTVYKASAGSGKTFTLAAEYIKFLVRNPAEYRHILAVTFTNKATDEMKTRILAQLFGISRGIAASDSYLAKIAAETATPAEEVRQTAALALSLLIHNYDYFHVETIDTFFQTVLRNLARELDLSPNLRLELNDTAVEQQAVDLMIEELDARSPFFRWIMEYVMDTIQDNKSWNVVRSMKEFGKMIFSNEYKLSNKQITKVLEQKGFVAAYTKKLLRLKDDALGALKKYSECFAETMAEYGLLPEDLRGGATRGIAKYFDRLATATDLADKNFMPGTVAKHLDSPDNWTNKTSRKRDTIMAAANERLIPLLRIAEEGRRNAQKTAVSVGATLKNINNLRLLSNIDTRVRQMNKEANRFLLSDTQHLLSLMISDTDSPFIFEKIGTRLEHIMIDEFQDTSTVQWKNFQILISECMSHTPWNDKKDVQNLVVGDVKQSIYRWRAGDWRLLANIEEQFPGRTIDIRELKTNYRSAANIVAFNNAFFSNALKLEIDNEQAVSEQGARLVERAYCDVEQKTGSSKEGGLVKITMLPKDDYELRTLQEIENVIDTILETGAKPSDIAILLRTNKYIPLIADYFMQHRPDICIVSDEAYRLDRSLAVSTIIAAIRLLYKPDDLVTRATLTKYAVRLAGKASDLTPLQMLSPDTDMLPAEYTTQAETLRQMPLHDLAERLMQIFMPEGRQTENAYICTFFDQLDAYTNDMAADATGFLQQWDETLHSLKIQTDGVEGIKLLSIHKSKGLEFDNVIVPFCNWRLEMTHGNYIWCRPAEEPYSELPLIPVDYSSKLLNSIYADDYKKEHMQNTIDNLNLLYVAFTRAGKNLFVTGKRGDSGSRSALIEQLAAVMAEKIPGAQLSGEEDLNDNLTFCFGTLLAGEEGKKGDSENVFMVEDTMQEAEVRSYPTPVVFRQSNKSKDFVAETEDGDNSDGSDKERRQFIKTGNIIHKVLENIATAADIPRVLAQYEADGILYGDGLSRQTLEQRLLKCISADERVADWFSGNWRLYNECTILSVDPDTGAVVEKRPDRVMKNEDKVVVVDFKTGAMHPQYNDQLRHYMSLLLQMGYTDVKGYLWFLNRGSVVEVKL